MFSKKYDFLAIGDITTDAFIRLKEASVHCDINKENCQICMNFADKIPYEFVEIVRAVGNSANASVSGSRLGLSSALVSNLGNDQNGKECLDTLKREKVSASFVTKHKGKETNYHYVLWYEDERTILVKHQQYDYMLPKINSPRWLYLSSVGGGTEKYHDEISEYLEKNPEIKFVFQPGTFQMALGYERLKSLYRRADVFVVNVSEAKKILGKDLSKQELPKAIASLGPKLVWVTDGPAGAYLFDGTETFFMPIYPDPKPPYERTGAGDAFASTFVGALALGKNNEDAAKWAMVNSMSVVQQVGAQKGLLNQPQITEWLKKAPANFGLKKI